eukprot:14920387-Ditylum_brightwellii.AAC.1
MGCHAICEHEKGTIEQRQCQRINNKVMIEEQQPVDYCLQDVLFVLHMPMVFMVVESFNLLTVGMSTMSLIAAAFLVETCAVISLSDRLGGRRLRILTSLSRKALSSNNGVFLRHIFKRRLQKMDPMWGGKVSLNKKSLVLLACCAQDLFKVLGQNTKLDLFCDISGSHKGGAPAPVLCHSAVWWRIVCGCQCCLRIKNGRCTQWDEQ